MMLLTMLLDVASSAGAVPVPGAPPDSLITALSPGGPIVVAVGVLGYSLIGALRDRKDQKATDEVLAHIQSRDAAIAALRADVDGLKAAEAARAKAEEREADKQAVREAVRAELDARTPQATGPTPRITSEFAAPAPTNPGAPK